MDAVRKLLAMLLLTVLLLPLVPSSMALGGDADARLPACCRREGTHHCAMRMGERALLAVAAPDGEHWRLPAERCPYSPASVTARHFDPLVLSNALPLLTRLQGPAAKVAQAESKQRIAREGARQKRGPPMFSHA